MIRKFKIFIALLFVTLYANAQDSIPKHVDMADRLRENGKIFVVVAVILTIFAGLIFYLVRIDRKLKRLEKSEGTNI